MCVFRWRGRAIHGTVTGHQLSTTHPDLQESSTHSRLLPMTFYCRRDTPHHCLKQTRTHKQRDTDMHTLPKRCVQIHHISIAKQCSELLLWPEEMLVYQANQLLVIISSVQMETLKWQWPDSCRCLSHQRWKLGKVTEFITSYPAHTRHTLLV